MWFLWGGSVMGEVQDWGGHTHPPIEGIVVPEKWLVAWQDCHLCHPDEVDLPYESEGGEYYR